jgi:hypothetical protein
MEAIDPRDNKDNQKPGAYKQIGRTQGRLVEPDVIDPSERPKADRVDPDVVDEEAAQNDNNTP